MNIIRKKITPKVQIQVRVQHVFFVFKIYLEIQISQQYKIHCMEMTIATSEAI